MRKIIFFLLAALILTAPGAYCIESAILDVSGKIFEESKEIKPLLENTKDLLIMSSMWDSCIIAKTQIDAYFCMLGVFNTIKEPAAQEKSLDYIVNWLNVMRKTGELNMKTLTAATKIYEPTTVLHIKKLNGYFAELNYRIDGELEKLATLKKSLRIGTKPPRI